MGEMTKPAEIRYERRHAGIWGKANPVWDVKLKSCAYATMTGATTRSYRRTGESRPGLGLRRSGGTPTGSRGRTGRNIANVNLIDCPQDTLRAVGGTPAIPLDQFGEQSAYKMLKRRTNNQYP